MADWIRTRSAGSSQLSSAGTLEANVGIDGVEAAAALAANRKVSRRLNVGSIDIVLSPEKVSQILDQHYESTKGS